MTNAQEHTIHEQNIEALCAIFRQGCKPADACTAVGIELEHTLVRTGSLLPVTYDEPGGARWLLERLAPDYPEAAFADDGRILGLARTEPVKSGRIESAKPTSHANEAPNARTAGSVPAQGTRIQSRPDSMDSLAEHRGAVRHLPPRLQAGRCLHGCRHRA